MSDEDSRVVPDSSEEIVFVPEGPRGNTGGGSGVSGGHGGGVGNNQMPHLGGNALPALDKYGSPAAKYNSYTKNLFPTQSTPPRSKQPKQSKKSKQSKQERHSLLWQVGPQKAAMSELRIGGSGLYKKENKADHAGTSMILMDGIAVDDDAERLERTEKPQPQVMADVDLSEKSENPSLEIYNKRRRMCKLWWTARHSLFNSRAGRLSLWIILSIIVILVPTARIISKSHQESSTEAQKLELTKLALTSGWSAKNQLDDPRSPQSAAIAWLAGSDQVLNKLSIDDAIKERYAMTVFFYSLAGEDWNLDGVNFMDPTRHVCEWFDTVQDRRDESFRMGLDCSCQALDEYDVDFCTPSSNSSVKRINLPHMNLHGSLPRELFLLEDLVELVLNSNDISGTFPHRPPHLDDLNMLRHVALADNEMDGPLFDWIDQAPSIRYVDISYNSFRDHLAPESLSTLTNLQVLNTNGNHLIGDLSVFKGMTELRALLLSANNITGHVRQELVQSLPNLEVLDVSNNRLEGEVMEGTIGHPNLQVLDLHKNQLTGAFPEIDAKGSKLAYLSLRENKLEGSLHHSLLDISNSLMHLDVARNKLSGPMPDMLSRLDELRYLDLSFNQWEAGDIPEGFGNLRQIKYLAMQATKREGELPHDMVQKWSNLEYLDLGHNLVTGMLPTNLGSATPGLRKVVLYHNALFGQLTPLENAHELETIILNGGNAWDDNVQLDVFCRERKFPDLETIVVRPCTNNEEESDMMLPYCSCCQCCPDANSPACSSDHWFPNSDNAWDTYATRRVVRTREPHLTDRIFAAEAHRGGDS